MRSRNQRLFAIAGMLVLAACGREMRRGSAEQSATISRVWPAGEVRDIEVREIDGSITVESAPVTQVSLVARAHGYDVVRKAGQENDGLFVTSLDGGTLSIGRRREKHHFEIPFIFGHEDVQIDYTLRVPPNVAADIVSVNGRVVARGMDADTRLKTVNGKIDVEATGSHEVEATTVNGHIKAKFLRAFDGAQFKTVNGGIDVALPKTASFNVDLSQINGDFEAAFPLTIHSNPGTRRVSGEVNGGDHELKIVTVNGDIELTRLNDL